MAKWTPRITRRGFLQATVGSLVARAAGAAPQETATPDGQPRIALRTLGKTGVSVSIMGEGGSTQFFKALPADPEEAEAAAIELLTTAAEGGITYFDTAHSYSRRGSPQGWSEILYGKALRPWREQVFIATKTGRRDRDGVLRELETSLERLGTEYVDLLQLHSITAKDDPTAINGKTGAFQALRELKEQKLIRFAGITGHSTAPHMKRCVDAFDGLDCALFPINAATDQRDQRAFKPEPENPDGHFETILLPHCVEKGIGVIAMKSTAQGYLIGEPPEKADAHSLFRYAMGTEGVTTTIIGPGSLENLKSNLKMAQDFEPMSKAERDALVAQLVGSYERLAYLRPGYEDA
jgi:aryl-alcohol dehydrogenase-like predicted oxidoreductase